jgi:hypothetical protein
MERDPVGDADLELAFGMLEVDALLEVLSKVVRHEDEPPPEGEPFISEESLGSIRSSLRLGTEDTIVEVLQKQRSC